MPNSIHRILVQGSDARRDARHHAPARNSISWALTLKTEARNSRVADLAGTAAKIATAGAVAMALFGAATLIVPRGSGTPPGAASEAAAAETVATPDGAAPAGGGGAPPEARKRKAPGNHDPSDFSSSIDRTVRFISETFAVPAHEARHLARLAAEAVRPYESTGSPELAVLDWHLVLAVIAKESAFKFVGNPGDLRMTRSRVRASIAANGAVEGVDPLRPHGLMQVDGRWHPEKMPEGPDGQIRVTSDRENIRAGVAVLAESLKAERGDISRALQRYNGNLKDESRRYANKVLQWRQEIQMAADEAT